MSWDNLRQMRQSGLRPKLPVVVTVDGKRPASLLSDLGCLIVQHRAGEKFPAELLDGLRVWLFLGNCGRAQKVGVMMAEKGIRPAEFQAWCECSKQFDRLPVSCEVAHEWQ